MLCAGDAQFSDVAHSSAPGDSVVATPPLCRATFQEATVSATLSLRAERVGVLQGPFREL